MWYINFDKEFWVYEYEIQEGWKDAIDRLRDKFPYEFIIEENICTIY